jgi:hypothetical protein
MIIRKLIIENYRNFTSLHTVLKKITLIFETRQMIGQLFAVAKLPSSTLIIICPIGLASTLTFRRWVVKSVHYRGIPQDHRIQTGTQYR